MSEKSPSGLPARVSSGLSVGMLAASIAPVLLSIVVSLVFWGHLWQSAAHTREASVELIGARAEELVLAEAGKADAMILSVDLALIQLREQLVPGHDINQAAAPLIQRFPNGSVVQIAVIDPGGYLVWSSLGAPAGAAKIYLGDRKHFSVHAARQVDDLYISEPVFGRASNRWTIQFSRRIEAGPYRGGVIVASVSPAYFSSIGAEAAKQSGNVVALFLSEGAYLARSSHLETVLGSQAPQGRPFIGTGAGESGLYRTRSPVDGIQRSYAWRRGHAYPVVTVVGINEAHALRAVEAELKVSELRARIGTVVVMLVSLLLSFFVYRLARSRARVEESERRYRAFFDGNTAIKMVVDPESGRILDANKAAADYYGYGLETLRSMHILSINVGGAAVVAEQLRHASSANVVCRNFKHRLANGEIRDVEVYTGPVGLNGKVVLYSIIHDVTERTILQHKLQQSESLHRSLFKTLAEGIIVVGPEGDITAWNDAALGILCVTPEQLVAREYVVQGPDGTRLDTGDFPSARTLRGEYIRQAMFSIGCPDGAERWVIVNSRRLEGDPETSRSAVVSFSDITDLVRAEESLRLSQSVFDAALEAIMVTDAANRILTVNPAFTRLTGYAPDEVIGRDPSLLASGQHTKAFYEQMWAALNHIGHWEGDLHNRRKDGSVYVESIRISVIPERPGHERRHVALFSDVTEQRRMDGVVWRQANHDALTGLPNRQLFEDRLARSIARAQRHAGGVSVLFIDLDRFKPVNDLYGHAAGDELLKQVGARLAKAFREEDTVARIGGDEFAVIVNEAVSAGAFAALERKINTLLEAPFDIFSNAVVVGCSIGMATYPDDASTLEALLALSDSRMYESKARRRSPGDQGRSLEDAVL